MTETENITRIEPTRLEEPTEKISDLVADIHANAALLSRTLHPKTAANLASLVRIVNSYYSNLIEGNNTRPKDIERALEGKLDKNDHRRNLQIEAATHVRLQSRIDELAAENQLPEPTSIEFLKWLHLEFYKDASKEMLHMSGAGRDYDMVPGKMRSEPLHDVSIGRHIPPTSTRVLAFMEYFQTRYQNDFTLGKTSRLIAMATAHHRFNFIHPFADGNGRVSRLMSHAMAHHAGIGAHGLWSISRGFARGLQSKSEYKMMMDLADSPRHGDFDGRGNLSKKALIEFVEWFLAICADQLKFMSTILSLDQLMHRFKIFVDRHETLKPEALLLLEHAFMRGEFERGEIPRITGLPERTARRVFNDTIATGLLASETPKGPVSLRFPTSTLGVLFPNLFD